MRKYLFLVCIIMILLLVGCETPHTHEFIEGVCGCGEVDPNYQAHTHNYIEGVCECGEIDPNYQTHTHNYVEGVCECGEIDPNYQTHTHNYVEGVCECGKANPNYPGHEHNYIDGVCACGDIYKVPKPDEIIYVEFESVKDLINDYNQKKEEYKYNYLVLNCDDIKADTLQHVLYMNYGMINEHKPVDGMIFQSVPVYIEEIGDCGKYAIPITIYIGVESYRFTSSSNELTYEITRALWSNFYIEVYDQTTLIAEISVTTTPQTGLTEEWLLNFVKENIVILK